MPRRPPAAPRACVLALCALAALFALPPLQTPPPAPPAGTGDAARRRAPRVGNRRVALELPCISPEQLERLATLLPQPAGEWALLVGNASYNVPSPSAAFSSSMLAALAQLLPPDSDAAGGAAAGQQLQALQQMVDELAELLGGSAGAAPLHSTAPLRRLCTAALLHLQERSPGPHWGSQHSALLEESLLLWLAVHQRHARNRRVEFTHISKAGGTSVCKLAAASGCRNPHTSLESNCMLPTLNDWPLWTQVISVQHGNLSHKLTPACAMYCPAYALYGAHGTDAPCSERAGASLGRTQGGPGDPTRSKPPAMLSTAPVVQLASQAGAPAAPNTCTGPLQGRPLTSTRRSGSCTAALRTPPARACARSCSA
jgi:hypothetical protein